MNLFPWSRSPYDGPDPDDGPQMIVMPGGTLMDRQWLEVERERCRQQDESIRARAEEREAAVRAVTAEADAEKAALKRELLNELRGAAGIVPPG
jgi:hypothetical protein